ncbi:MAG TPA: hypothetical protein VN577_22320 [Terriglobales bacterium]|nr:hypothetical protein [Terriglobales bacterium]
MIRTIFSDTLRQRVVLLFVVMLVMAGTASAQLWVASTGTVDEGSLGTFFFTSGIATVRPTVASGFAIIRYNVLPVGTLVQPVTDPCCESRALMVRYQDDGPNARVIVTLKRYNVHTGQVTTLLTFDSNQHPQQSGFQEPVPTISDGSFFNFNFAEGPTEGTQDLGGDSAYYIEAQLIRSAPGGNPALASVRLVTVKAP